MLLVQQALAAGYEVVGFVRDPDKMTIIDSHLTLIKGDVMNAADVDRGITDGVDAVISTLAPTNNSPKDMLSVAIHHPEIISGMKRPRKRRPISLNLLTRKSKLPTTKAAPLH